MAPIIIARGLRKTYGDLEAVRSIDFSVMPGEIFGMLGPNGAGKTTTIRMLSCVTPVTSGELLVDGLDVRTHDREIKARLGVVPQADNLDPDLSVRQNLETYARYFDVPKAVAAERIDEGLELMQLRDRANASVGELSGGMQRRLVIARSLVNAPSILVLDEPTTGLDPQARHLVWRKLRLLRDRGATLLITTHYMDEAEQLCDQLVFMDEGRILEEGNPRDLVERYVGLDVLEMHLSPPDVERVRAYLDPVLQNGGRLEAIDDVLYGYHVPSDQARGVEELIGDRYRIRNRRANLEDVFLTLTGRALVEN